MAYATKQSMIDRFGEPEMIRLTDRATPTSGVIDDVVMNGALADAENEVNGYLAARYLLPLTSTPKAVVNALCDIARYRLHIVGAPEMVVSRFNDAIRLLRSIAAGTVALMDDATGLPLSAPTAAVPGQIAAPTKTIRFGSDFDAKYDYA